MSNKYFYKKNSTDKIYWVENDEIGVYEFSFDQKTIYNLFADYPHKLTQAQRQIFDEENPYWANFFKGRK